MVSNEGGDALVDGELGAFAAEVGLDPAGVEEQQRPGVFAVAGGVAAHELVERGLAGPVDLVPPVGVQSDAALAGGHDSDRSARDDQRPEGPDDAQRAQSKPRPIWPTA